MELLLIAAGLVLIVEGMPWFLSPQAMRKLLSRAAHLSDPVLRFCGLTAMLGGLLVIYLVRH